MWIRLAVAMLAAVLCAGTMTSRKVPEDSEPQPELGIHPVGVESEPSVESKEKEAEISQFFNDWLEYMQGFDPSNMLNVELPAGAKYVFFERAQKAPLTLRGVYSVAEEAGNKIKFVIYDPHLRPIMTKLSKRENVFHFQINETGEYRFEFTNTNVCCTLRGITPRSISARRSSTLERA